MKWSEDSEKLGIVSSEDIKQIDKRRQILKDL